MVNDSNLDTNNQTGVYSESTQENYRKYTQWCQECPKAYDYTCSGADASRCEKEKQEFLNHCRKVHRG